MALSGSMDTNAPYQGRYMHIEWSATQSIANNSSYVSILIYPVGGTSSYYTTGISHLEVNGEEVKTWARQDMYKETQSHSRWEGRYSTTIYHNSAGEANLQIVFWTYIYYGNGNPDGLAEKARNWTLNTIPRATEISAIPSFNLEDYLSCTFTPYVDTFTHSLDVSINNESIVTVNPYTSGSTVTLTNAQILHAYEAMGTAKSADFTFSLTTYNGGTSLGTKTKVGTGTCAGTSDIRVGGVYKRALPWINDNGTWKKALGFSKDGATWKRGL